MNEAHLYKGDFLTLRFDGGDGRTAFSKFEIIEANHGKLVIRAIGSWYERTIPAQTERVECQVHVVPTDNDR